MIRLIFVISLLFSNFAISEGLEVTSVSSGRVWLLGGKIICRPEVGKSYTVESLSSCISSHEGNKYCSTSNSGLSYNGIGTYGTSSIYCLNSTGARYVLALTEPTGESCAYFDEETGECLGACIPPQELNPETNECWLPPFCDRESTISDIDELQQQCHYDLGGIFTYHCDNFLETLNTKCNHQGACAPGMASYPECLGDIDPTDPITPPDGGFNPSPLPPVDTNPPVDNAPPDEIPPQDGTDSAVLQAIQNQHADMNTALNHISGDLNQGFADVNNNLRSINQTNNAIGQTIVDQMNQDYEIHQQNMVMGSAQIGAITNVTHGVTDAIESQTLDVVGSIGKSGDNITDAIGNLNETSNAILDAIEGIGDDERCYPNEENNYLCPETSGLTESTVYDINAQINQSTTEIIDSGESQLMNAVHGYVEDAGVGEGKSNIESMIYRTLGLLPSESACRSFSIPLPNGKSIDFGCEFSVKFKQIASWLIYLFTLWTLTDILLNGVTPLPVQPERKMYY